MKTTFLFIILLIAASDAAFPQSTFQILFGGPNEERAQTAFETFDGNYLINGASTSYGSGSADGVFIKCDVQGNILSSFYYGTSDYENPEYAIETYDQGLVAAGRRGLGPVSALLYKTDAAGTLLWSKSYGTITQNEGFTHVSETNNHDLVMTGVSVSATRDILFVRTDEMGDTLATKVYEAPESENAGCVIQTSDGNFVICGRKVYSISGSDGMMMKIDPDGNVLWSYVYGDSLWEELFSVIELSDGSLIAAGATVSSGAGNYDVLLLHTDSAGIPLWSVAYGGTSIDASYDVHETSDGDLLVSGYTESFGAGHSRGNDSTNIFLMKTDIAGNLLWLHTYGDGKQDEAFRCGVCSDGGYIIPGFTTSYILVDSTQFYIIKTDNNGFSGCHETVAAPVVTPFAMPYSPVSFTLRSGMLVNNQPLTTAAFTTINNDACLISYAEQNKSIDTPGFKIITQADNSLISILFEQKYSGNVYLTNLSGQLLVNKFCRNTASFELSVAGIDAGIYFVWLVDETGNRQVEKFFCINN
jgi:hypothetical protein